VGTYNLDSAYAIGLEPTQMVYLRQMNIAPPDQIVYKPAAVYYVRSDFSRVGDGFASVEWVWDMISISRLHNIISFLDGEDYASLYVLTDKRDGSYPNPRTSFGLFYATMWKPIITGEEGVFVARSPYVVQTVKLQFVNMVEMSGYL
jgi:hypothetical protein